MDSILSPPYTDRLHLLLLSSSHPLTPPPPLPSLSVAMAATVIAMRAADMAVGSVWASPCPQNLKEAGLLPPSSSSSRCRGGGRPLASFLFSPDVAESDSLLPPRRATTVESFIYVELPLWSSSFAADPLLWSSKPTVRRGLFQWWARCGGAGGGGSRCCSCCGVNVLDLGGWRGSNGSWD